MVLPSAIEDGRAKFDLGSYIAAIFLSREAALRWSRND